MYLFYAEERKHLYVHDIEDNIINDTYNHNNNDVT